MTRVLHILDHSLPLHSGYTFRTRAILKAQQAAGMEVRGVTGLRHSAECPQIDEVDGLVFHRTEGERKPIPVLGEIGEVRALSRQIRDTIAAWRPEVIHAHSPALCGLAAHTEAKRHGIPFVYEIRAFWEDAAVGNGTGREGSPKYRLTRWLENRVVNKADAVFTICNGLRSDLVARGHDAAKIHLSPNGVDLSLFGDPPPRDDALAARLGLSDGPVIGFIGSFYDYEGLDDLIEAMPRLRGHHPGAQLLLVGGGPMDGPLRARAAASSSSDAIHFTGRVPHDEVERYYSLVDVLAYPRKKSRLTDLVTPLKPLEAMAQGRIVAASAVGGHRELIDDGETGYLFAPDDPEALADTLGLLLRERTSWPAMREAGRAHVAGNHDWSHNVLRYQAVYQDLLGEPPNREAPQAVDARSGALM